MHMRLKVDTTLEHVIFGASAVRSGITQTDKFRVKTAADSQFGIRMNTVVEQAISVRFAFLRDVQQSIYEAAKAMKGDEGFTLRWEPTQKDNQELFDELCASRRLHRWYDTGHWRSVCLYASFMKLEGYALAEAEQILDDPDYWEGRGSLEAQMRAVVAAHAEQVSADA